MINPTLFTFFFIVININTAQDKQNFEGARANIFLTTSLADQFGCSKEPSH